MTPAAPLPCPIELPPGVRPVAAIHGDPDRIPLEREIIRLPVPRRMAAQSPLWARELIIDWCSNFRRGRVQLAYSVDAAGQMVRCWYLLQRDYGDPNYGTTRGPLCPIQAAWLESIAPGRLSVPAWAYLIPGGLSIPVETKIKSRS
jgi:hypothetical protein